MGSKFFFILSSVFLLAFFYFGNKFNGELPNKEKLIIDFDAVGLISNNNFLSIKNKNKNLSADIYNYKEAILEKEDHYKLQGLYLDSCDDMVCIKQRKCEEDNNKCSQILSDIFPYRINLDKLDEGVEIEDQKIGRFLLKEINIEDVFENWLLLVLESQMDSKSKQDINVILKKTKNKIINRLYGDKKIEKYLSIVDIESKETFLFFDTKILESEKLCIKNNIDTCNELLKFLPKKSKLQADDKNIDFKLNSNNQIINENKIMINSVFEKNQKTNELILGDKLGMLHTKKDTKKLKLKITKGGEESSVQLVFNTINFKNRNFLLIGCGTLENLKHQNSESHIFIANCDIDKELYITLDISEKENYIENINDEYINIFAIKNDDNKILNNINNYQIYLTNDVNKEVEKIDLAIEKNIKMVGDNDNKWTNVLFSKEQSVEIEFRVKIKNNSEKELDNITIQDAFFIKNITLENLEGAYKNYKSLNNNCQFKIQDTGEVAKKNNIFLAFECKNISIGKNGYYNINGEKDGNFLVLKLKAKIKENKSHGEIFSLTKIYKEDSEDLNTDNNSAVSHLYLGDVDENNKNNFAVISTEYYKENNNHEYHVKATSVNNKCNDCYINVLFWGNMENLTNDITPKNENCKMKEVLTDLNLFQCDFNNSDYSKNNFIFDINLDSKNKGDKLLTWSVITSQTLNNNNEARGSGNVIYFDKKYKMGELFTKVTNDGNILNIKSIGDSYQNEFYYFSDSEDNLNIENCDVKITKTPIGFIHYARCRENVTIESDKILILNNSVLNDNNNKEDVGDNNNYAINYNYLPKIRKIEPQTEINKFDTTTSDGFLTIDAETGEIINGTDFKIHNFEQYNSKDFYLYKIQYKIKENGVINDKNSINIKLITKFEDNPKFKIIYNKKTISDTDMSKFIKDCKKSNGFYTCELKLTTEYKENYFMMYNEFEIQMNNKRFMINFFYDTSDLENDDLSKTGGRYFGVNDIEDYRFVKMEECEENDIYCVHDKNYDYKYKVINIKNGSGAFICQENDYLKCFRKNMGYPYFEKNGQRFFIDIENYKNEVIEFMYRQSQDILVFCTKIAEKEVNPIKIKITDIVLEKDKEIEMNCTKK